MKKFLMATLMGGAFLAGMAAPASAYIACNREGECWHVKSRYAYEDRAGVTVHRDNWRWRGRDHYRWREHEGRGYWRSGVWIGF